MSAAYVRRQRVFLDRSTLEDLLADDMIQSIMQADGVSPTFLRTLLSEVEEKRWAWTGRPVKHGLRVLCRRTFDRFLPYRFLSDPNGPYLQGSLLMVSAAVVWLALGHLMTGNPHSPRTQPVVDDPITPGTASAGQSSADIGSNNDDGITIPVLGVR